jgi:DNA-binding PadR family transcriptional regulator
MDERDERILLLLGLLSTERQHGYQINEFIERNLGQVSQMRKATAYALLNRMSNAGLVEASSEQEGNRPPRRVFSLTPEGARLFSDMLVGVLAEPVIAEPPGDIALMFIDHLDRDVAVAAIEARIASLTVAIEALESSPPHGAGIGVDMAIRRRAVLLRADRDWFERSREEVRAGLPEEANLPVHAAVTEG